MISIRQIDYDTVDDPEIVFSRIPWAVTKVNEVDRELISRHTIDTHRQWIGEYDKERMNFKLIEPRRFFSPQFFQIVVRGQISKIENGKTIVGIKFRLGLYTFGTFLMIYLATPFIIWRAILDGELNAFAGLMFWLIVFPGLGTLLLHWKLDKVEKKIENLFGF
jgi:hypothetical protein